MVRVAVVVAHDVEAGGVRLALDADVIARIDLVPVSCAVDDDVARALDLGDLAVVPGSDHDAADLVRVALGSVRTNRLDGCPPDLHVFRPYKPVDRSRSPESGD